MIESIYLWIVIVGGFTAFFSAMGIGANDVANAFATSVGSKALTMKGAVVIATIFELPFFQKRFDIFKKFIRNANFSRSV